MKHSLKHGAGYLTVDHTNSPGTAEIPGGSVLERDFLVCTHCERQVILHPLRTRDRGYCQKCNAFLCDGCESVRVRTGACVPMKQVLDRAATLAEKHARQTDHPDLAILNDPIALSQPDAPKVVLTDA